MSKHENSQVAHIFLKKGLDNSSKYDTPRPLANTNPLSEYFLNMMASYQGNLIVISSLNLVVLNTEYKTDIACTHSITL